MSKNRSVYDLAKVLRLKKFKKVFKLKTNALEMLKNRGVYGLKGVFVTENDTL